MIRKILFPTDFTGASRLAEDVARELAGATGAGVLALHAIEPIDPGGDEDPFATFYQALRSEAESRLAEARRRFEEASVACQALIVLAERWQAILDTADREGVSLIVMGSRPLMQDGRMTVGSTSHKVFLGTDVPLLIVRSGAAAGGERCEGGKP